MANLQLAVTAATSALVPSITLYMTRYTESMLNNKVEQGICLPFCILPRKRFDEIMMSNNIPRSPFWYEPYASMVLAKLLANLCINFPLICVTELGAKSGS
jgi:hypothetical protein